MDAPEQPPPADPAAPGGAEDGADQAEGGVSGAQLQDKRSAKQLRSADMKQFVVPKVMLKQGGVLHHVTRNWRPGDKQDLTMHSGAWKHGRLVQFTVDDGGKGQARLNSLSLLLRDALGMRPGDWVLFKPRSQPHHFDLEAWRRKADGSWVAVSQDQDQDQGEGEGEDGSVDEDGSMNEDGLSEGEGDESCEMQESSYSEGDEGVHYGGQVGSDSEDGMQAPPHAAAVEAAAAAAPFAPSRNGGSLAQQPWAHSTTVIITARNLEGRFLDLSPDHDAWESLLPPQLQGGRSIAVRLWDPYAAGFSAGPGGSSGSAGGFVEATLSASTAATAGRPSCWLAGRGVRAWLKERGVVVGSRVRVAFQPQEGYTINLVGPHGVPPPPAAAVAVAAPAPAAAPSSPAAPAPRAGGAGGVGAVGAGLQAGGRNFQSPSASGKGSDGAGAKATPPAVRPPPRGFGLLSPQATPSPRPAPVGVAQPPAAMPPSGEGQRGGGGGSGLNRRPTSSPPAAPAPAPAGREQPQQNPPPTPPQQQPQQQQPAAGGRERRSSVRPAAERPRSERPAAAKARKAMAGTRKAAVSADASEQSADEEDAPAPAAPEAAAAAAPAAGFDPHCCHRLTAPEVAAGCLQPSTQLTSRRGVLHPLLTAAVKNGRRGARATFHMAGTSVSSEVTAIKNGPDRLESMKLPFLRGLRPGDVLHIAVRPGASRFDYTVRVRKAGTDAGGGAGGLAAAAGSPRAATPPSAPRAKRGVATGARTGGGGSGDGGGGAGGRNASRRSGQTSEPKAAAGRARSAMPPPKRPRREMPPPFRQLRTPPAHDGSAAGDTGHGGGRRNAGGVVNDAGGGPGNGGGDGGPVPGVGGGPGNGGGAPPGNGIGGGPVPGVGGGPGNRGGGAGGPGNGGGAPPGNGIGGGPVPGGGGGPGNGGGGGAVPGAVVVMDPASVAQMCKGVSITLDLAARTIEALQGAGVAPGRV
ncbi:hypothetical protein HYH03_007382 [Edaphochlamys debaryana]|uniref:Uncharacterized protein n=1 Tax=Edaphochlamys debaryana TaxID=47281 RepID=A0A835Y329_9CHLO|nr:hypothetical protein HYH03_007382 [Edaphochlamys debaryana]|eukprot:KAG2494324.1 hypothetical protein HYH03_007382 [Edaphochlamys debaryana]